MARRWKVLEARVDWITATGKTGTHGTRLLDLGATLLTEQRELGNNGRPTTFQGYHGTQSNHCFVGYRMDGSCIRLGGNLAGDRWSEVANLASNVSRLDVAVTCTCEPAAFDLALDYWRTTARMAPKAGRPLDYSIIQSRGSGSTLYCGKRASERFGRVYDKHAESKGVYPPGSWRFEIEYKQLPAKEIASRMATARDVRGAILGLVEQRFQDWGLITPWDGSAPEFDDKAIKDPSDNERRFKWLTESVSQTVATCGVSYTSEQLRKALGLQVQRVLEPLANPRGAPEQEWESRVPHPTIADCYIVSDG